MRYLAIGWLCVLLGVAWQGSAAAATLENVVSTTLESNPEVLALRHERLVRDQELVQARSDYRPKLDLVAVVGRENNDTPSTRAQGFNDIDLTRREIELQARQLLFDGFATKNNADRQEARIESAAYALYDVSERTGLSAIDVYLEVLRRRQLLELSKENLAAHLSIYDQIKARSASGVGRKSDSDQVESRVALAQASVISDEFNLIDAETDYHRVVNEFPGDLERPVPPTDRLPSSIDEAMELAVEYHPVLKSATADVDANIAEHEGTRNGYYPRIDLEVFTGVREDLDGLQGDHDDYGVLLRMRYNFYRGGFDAARIKQTAAEVEEAREIRNNSHRQVVQSVRLSWIAYEANQTLSAHLRQRVESSIKTRDAYKTQFNIGQRTLLDLLDIENELIDAKRELLNSDFTGLFAQYRILVGTGQLLQALGISLPEETEIN
ncbi:MAG: TolC family outer membrane protein [Gammaproteobacteria bacterium]|nr:TolC family outer membrane protein [Gammaproteobacteria bacterium]MDH3465685.1 TolC family outer membrane protein [Gammaproteobacteria bacterium]